MALPASPQPPTITLPGNLDAVYAGIAQEIACGMNDLETILKNHGIPIEEFERIKSNKRFVDILVQATNDWNSANNVHDRIELKAAYAVEQALSDLYAHMLDTTQPLSGRAVLLSQFMEMGGIKRRQAAKAANSNAESVAINIVINGSAMTFTKEKVIEHQPEDSLAAGMPPNFDEIFEQP